MLFERYLNWYGASHCSQPTNTEKSGWFWQVFKPGAGYPIRYEHTNYVSPPLWGRHIVFALVVCLSVRLSGCPSQKLVSRVSQKLIDLESWNLVWMFPMMCRCAPGVTFVRLSVCSSVADVVHRNLCRAYLRNYLGWNLEIWHECSPEYGDVHLRKHLSVHPSVTNVHHKHFCHVCLRNYLGQSLAICHKCSAEYVGVHHIVTCLSQFVINS